jgi:hypothetical protein
MKVPSRSEVPNAIAIHKQYLFVGNSTHIVCYNLRSQPLGWSKYTHTLDIKISAMSVNQLGTELALASAKSNQIYCFGLSKRKFEGCTLLAVLSPLIRVGKEDAKSWKIVRDGRDVPI